MAESKLRNLSVEFSVKIIKLCESQNKKSCLLTGFFVLYYSLSLTEFFIYLRFILSDKSPYKGVANPKPPETVNICPVV